MGVDLMPLAKNSSGTVVTTPAAGSSSHCHPWSTPTAPAPRTSAAAMNTRAAGDRTSVSKNTDTPASTWTPFLMAPYTAKLPPMTRATQGICR